MVKAIKNFFAKRCLEKRLAITRKQFNQIKDRNIPIKHKTRLAYLYLKKIHAIQRSISEI